MTAWPVTCPCAPQGKPGAGAGGRDAVAELRDGAGSGSGPIFEHGTAHGHGPFARLRRALRRASLGSKLVLASLLAAIVILGITTVLLATHITRSLDNNARQQLSHDVGLLRAAISSRIDNANSAAIEYSKILADQIDETLGGPNQASRETFVALLAASGKSSGKPLDLFLRNLRGSGSIFVLTPQGFERAPDHRHQRTGRIGRRQLSRHRPPGAGRTARRAALMSARSACLAGST